MKPGPQFFSDLMKVSLEEANKAFLAGEVPVGAVISDGEKIISTACNEIEARQDSTAHAEILAIRKASQEIGSWRLNNLILCVTIEPCTMCLGAIKQSRISTIVFGARDEKFGACGSLYDLSIDSRLGNVTRVICGVEEAACRKLMQDFFSKSRALK